MKELKNISLAIAFAGLLVITAGTFNQTFAQNKSKKNQTIQKYEGSPVEDSVVFKKFIIENINKKVYLSLTFKDEDVYGYKSGNADPIFNVDNYSYWFKCGEEMTAMWTERCSNIKRSEDNNNIYGYFMVKEPQPKIMRTNRTFDLIPVAGTKPKKSSGK